MNSYVEKWIGAINTHNIDLLEELASTDHVFFVEGETPTIGKNKVRPSWQGYFDAYPNYKIFIDDYYQKDDAYYLMGHTSDSHIKPELESIPGSVIWRCELRGSKVTEWSIYDGSSINREKYGLFGSGN